MVHFLASSSMFPEKSWIARDLGIQDLIATIDNDCMFYDMLPRNKLMGLMKKIRVTTIVSGLLGSFADSICMGAVPLCYDGHQYRAAGEKHNIKLNTYEATEDEIFNCIKKLYTDDKFYEEVIKDYRNELRYYSFDESYKYFKKMTKDLLL